MNELTKVIKINRYGLQYQVFKDRRPFFYFLLHWITTWMYRPVKRSLRKHE